MIKHNNNSFSSVYDEITIIGKIYKGTIKVFEAWKKLIASGVPPFKIYSKGNNKGYTLPSEYQEVEYIESTGTQYINTNYIDVPETRIELDFVYTGRLGTSSYTGANGGNVMAINSSGILAINAKATGITSTVGERYKINSYRDADNNRIGTINGVEYIGTKASRNEMYHIFTLGGLATSTQRIYGKLYSCKIYYQDELVRDFIPCYRKSDNVIGLYDLANNEFYTNDGTGTFLKGKNVATGLDLIDYKVYGNSTQEKLPSDYQRVEYVEGTGTQYLELDYIASDITNSKGTYQLTNTSSALMLFGSRTDSTSNGYALNWGGGKNPCVFFNTYYSGGTAGLTNTSVSAEITDFEKRGAELYINDELIHTHSTPPAFTTPYNMIVFGCNSGGTINYFAKAKIFNLQFYDNDELKVDLIPCYRKSDSVIGMYDTVTGTFYTNKGTGTFLKGNDTTLIPTPETPIEVESVGDKTVNIFDKNNYTNLPYYIVVSNLSLDSTDERSIYINCEPNTTYTISKSISTTMRVATCVDVPKYGMALTTAVEGTGVPLTITSGENDKYLIIQLLINGDYTNGYRREELVNYLQVEKGSIATPKESYGYKIPVEVSVKENLLKLNDAFRKGNALEYASKNQLISKKCISYVQTSYLLQLGAFDDIIGTSKLKAGTYIWSIYDFSGTPIITNPYIVLTTSTETINWSANTPITLTEEATLTQLRSDELKYSVGSTQQFRILIQEGDTLIEPITTNIYLKEPLRKIGDYADYIDFENKKVVRNIHNEFVTTVNSKSSLAGTYALFLTNVTELPLTKNTGNNMIGYAISNKFLQNKLKYIDLLENGGYIQPYVTSKGIVTLAYSFNDESITTVEQAQEKIGDGFEVNYVLETPIEETTELPNIPTIKGTTVIEVDTDIQPSNMEVTYKGKGE